MSTMKPPRVSLHSFPDVVLHAPEIAVKKHPHYRLAKGGDILAADALVADMANADCMPRLQALIEGRQVELVSVHALEAEGVNEIPAAFAKLLSVWLGSPSNESIVQSNTVGHTGASGFQRLANQAHFFGQVKAGRHFLLVDGLGRRGGAPPNLIRISETPGRPSLAAPGLCGATYS